MYILCSGLVTKMIMMMIENDYVFDYVIIMKRIIIRIMITALMPQLCCE